jgi:DNA-binding CsgD family transcriptional regulator
MYGSFAFLGIPLLTTLAMFVWVDGYETSPTGLLHVLLLGGFLVTGWRIYLRRRKREKLSLISMEQHKMQQLKNEMLEAELENKKNELAKQTSMLIQKKVAVDTLLEELEHQKSMLGDRYPASLYKRMRSLMEKVLNNKDDVLESYFDNAHQSFIERFRRQYAGITVGDLRICCLLRMSLSTKEIASILHISVRAVELRRYRLRKRIGLDNETNLIHFLMNF